MKYPTIICLVILFGTANSYSQSQNKHQLSVEYVRMNGLHESFNRSIQFYDRSHHGDVLRLRYAKKTQNALPINVLPNTYLTFGYSQQRNKSEHVCYDYNSQNETEISNFEFSDGTNTYSHTITRRRQDAAITQTDIQTLDLGIQLTSDDANHLKFEVGTNVSMGVAKTSIKNTFSRDVYTTSQYLLGPTIANTTTLAAGPIYESDNFKNDSIDRYFLIKWQTQFGVRYDFGEKQRFGIRLFAETSFAGSPTKHGFSYASKYGKLGIGTVFHI